MADQAPAWDDLPSFDSLPDAAPSKGPATQAAGPPAWDSLPSWEDLPDGKSFSGTPQRRPEAENPLISGVREGLHALVPGIAGAAVAPLGAAAGTVVAPGVGTFAGGAGAFIGGSLAAEYAQDKFLKNVVGFDDDAQRQANREANPKSTFAGGLAGGMATMGTQVGGSLAKQAMQRAAGGAAMGGFEAGSEALQGEDLSPTQIGMATVAGAVAPGLNRLGKRVQAPAEKWLAGRPGKVSNPAAAQAHEDVGATQTETAAPGTATEQTAAGPTGETTGNPQSAPTRSERQYGKDRLGSYDEENILTRGDMDPATLQAMQQSAERSALHNESALTEIPGQAPQESLPIKTGIEEAAGAAPTTANAAQAMQKPRRGPKPPQQVDAGFPKPGEEVAEGVSQPEPDLSKLIKPAKAESAIARSKAAAATPSDRVDTGFPKPGEEVAVGSSEPLTPSTESVFQKLSKQGLSKADIMNMSPEEMQAAALKNLTHPEKRGTTTPNDQLSDAQKRAGNYEKASVRDFGHDLKIETERGDKRRSLDDSPVKWENVSPADYGYFKKTIGADKDHVDFYRADPDMPEFGDKHFIVDQRDANTGKFDEHKVMNYFKDLDAARETYLKGFSDDKALARLHDMREVSPQELSLWLRTKKKTKPYGEPMPKEVTVTVKKPKAKTGVAIEGAEGVTANTVEDAQRKSQALQDYRKVFEDHGPAREQNSPETNAQTIARARAAIEAASKLDNYPTKMAVKQAPAQWLREAKKIIRRPTEQMLKDFRANEVLLRSGDKDAIKDVRDTNRITADTELARGRGGDVAETTAPADMPEGPAEAPTELKPEPVKDAADLSKLLTKNKELDLTKPAEAAEVAADTKKIVANLIKINDTDAGTRPPTNRASEALSYVEKGAPTKKPLKTEVGGKASEVRSIDDPAEMKRIVDAANERMKSKKSLSPEELDAQDLTKQAAQLPRDTQGEERMWKRFLNNEDASLNIDKIKADAKRFLDLAKEMAERGPGWSKNPVKNPRHMQAIELRAAGKTFAEIGKEMGIGSTAANHLYVSGTLKLRERSPEHLVEKFLRDDAGSLNHTKIANDFKAKGNALRHGLEKYFGMPIGEVGKKIDSVLARSVSTTDSLNAEKANQLAERWFAWVKGATKDEQWTYLKTLEKTKQKTPAGIEADLVLAGIPKDKAKWMADEALFHKALMDDIWLEDNKHGSKADYVENYVAHIYKGDHKLAAEYLQQLGVKHVGATWYQKGRTFDLLEQAKKAGFEMRYSNPIDLIQARWAASIKSNMMVATARGLHDIGMAFPVKDAPKILTTREGWQFKRTLPDGQQWVFAPGAENLWINAMEPKGLNEMQNVGGGIYRWWMGIKRVWAPIQLAFSAFHELHVAANINVAENLTRALTLSKHEFTQNAPMTAALKSAGHYLDAAKWSLSDPLLALPLDKLYGKLGNMADAGGHFSQFAGRKAMNWWRVPVDQLTPVQRLWKRAFQEGGISPHQSNEDVIGAKRDFAQALADLRNAKGMGNVGPGARVAFQGIARGIEKMQEPMFKYQIPALKNIAYMRNIAAANKIDPELATNATKRGVVYREIGKSIDDRFGEMFYKGLFWNKTVKDAGIGSFLSLSWNLGQFRQVAGAAKNIGIGAARLAGRQQPDMADAIYRHSNKAAFVGNYVALSMMSAGALSFMLSGEFPTGLDYVFPRNGQKNPDGTPGRLSTPFNTREPFMLKAHAEQHNSWVGGGMEFLWNKMVLSPLVEIFQNKDFFSNKLYDPNTSWYKKALQAADSTAGRMFNPISLSGADRAKQQGGGKLGQALAVAGFNPAPKYVEADAMQNRINHSFSEEVTASSRPYEYGPKTGLGRGLVQGAIRSVKDDKLQSEARHEGRQVMEQGRLHGDAEAERAGRLEMIKEGGLSTKTKMRPDTEFEYKFARLPKFTQAALARDMTAAQFQRYVITNKQAGLSPQTKAFLIKERSTNR